MFSSERFFFFNFNSINYHRVLSVSEAEFISFFRKFLKPRFFHLGFEPSWVYFCVLCEIPSSTCIINQTFGIDRSHFFPHSFMSLSPQTRKTLSSLHSLLLGQRWGQGLSVSALLLYWFYYYDFLMSVCSRWDRSSLSYLLQSRLGYSLPPPFIMLIFRFALWSYSWKSTSLPARRPSVKS